MKLLLNTFMLLLTMDMTQAQSDLLKIEFYGNSAFKIQNSNHTLYVDAGSGGLENLAIKDADIMLYTHDDADHFVPQLAARHAKESQARIIGPPSITYPLLVNENFPSEKLQVFQPQMLNRPSTVFENDLLIKAYGTEHFNGWHPVHLSYYIALGDKRIYVNGDSYEMDTSDADLHKLDYLIYNVVPVNNGIQEIIQELINVNQSMQPDTIILSHTHANFLGIDHEALKVEIDRHPVLKNVIIPFPNTFKHSVEAESKIPRRKPANLAYGKQVTASSSENNAFNSNMINDEWEFTRWASLANDEEWICIDLGSKQTIKQVVLNWESAFGKAYRIEASKDSLTWVPIYHETNSDGGIDKVELNEAISARYVKLVGEQRATNWGYSLWEMEIY